MSKVFLKILFVYYLIAFASLFLFRELVKLCFLPLGVELTILGYLTSIIGIIVLSVSTGMMMAIAQKKSGLNSLTMCLMLPLFTTPVVLFLKYVFSNEWEYVLLVTLPSLLLSVLFWKIGEKAIKRSN